MGCVSLYLNKYIILKTHINQVKHLGYAFIFVYQWFYLVLSPYHSNWPPQYKIVRLNEQNVQFMPNKQGGRETHMGKCKFRVKIIVKDERESLWFLLLNKLVRHPMNKTQMDMFVFCRILCTLKAYGGAHNHHSPFSILPTRG